MMDEENNVDAVKKLWQRIKRPGKPKPNSGGNECEIQRSTFKELNVNFDFKSIKKLSAEKYEAFVKKLQKRFNLSEENKDSLLDALDCEENEEKLGSLKFNDGKGYIYQGWYIAQMKDGKLDVAYTIYTADFELAEKETEDWVFNWWFIIPIGWKYNVELQMLTPEQIEKLDQWCELQLYNMVHQTFEKSEF